MDSPEVNEEPMKAVTAPEMRASREGLAVYSDHDAGPPREEVKPWERVAPSPKRSAYRFGLPWLLALCVFTFGGCDSEQADPPPSADDTGDYQLVDSVDLRIADRTDETIDAGDFFSDMTMVWSGDQIAGDGASVGDFRVALPVNIEVIGGENITLNIEDVFGDNQFTWQRLERLNEQVRRVGGEFEVDMPVVIRVSDSQGVQVDLEDVFGDNSFTWTVGTPSEADSTLEAGQIPGGVGGPVRISMSVLIEVVDSQDIVVDVEDVVSDMSFDWAGGDRGATAFVGGSMRFEVPLTFRVERSERVRVNLEDTAGDLTLDWTAGASESVGGPVRFDVPTSFNIVGSRDVNIDFEDQGSDNIFTWTVDGHDADAPELSTPAITQTPAEFRVIDSQQVRINSEDFFGDNVFVRTGPFSPDARSGLDGSVSASAATAFRVEGSDDVNIDAEDVYGDNVFAWDPLSLGQASPLPASVYEVVGDVTRDVVESDSVTIEFANLNQGNQYLWGPPPEIDR